MKVLIHADADRTTPGKLLRFTGNDIKQVQANGSLVSLVRDADGKLSRPVKLSEKQRVKLRRAAAASVTS